MPKIKLFIFSLISLLFICIYLIVTTTFGLKLILNLLPGTVTIKEISGSLWQGWSLKQFDYKNNQYHIYLGEMRFSWQALALLKKNIIVNELNIKNARIDVTLTSSEKNTNFNLPDIDFPINLYLPKISLENIEIHYNQQRFLVKKNKLSANFVNNFLDLKNFTLETPDFLTSTYGVVDMRSWSSIEIHNNFTLISHSETPITTEINGNRKIISLKTTSKKWLDIIIDLKNYLGEKENITLESHWKIAATKSVFKELNKLDGKFLVSGEAHGYLLNPKITGEFLAKDIYYDNYAIKNLSGRFNLLPDKNQKINFSLSGKNIFLDEILINSIKLNVFGTLKKHDIKLNLHMLDNYFFNFSGQGDFPNNKTYLIKNATLDAKPLNLIFFPINIIIKLDQKNLLSYQVIMRHNNENLTLTGNTQLFSADFKTALSLNSKQFTLIDTKSYKIIASPDLHLDYDNLKTTITGVLKILKAHIAPVDFSNTITLSSDIVYVNNQDEPLYKKNDLSPFYLNILIKLEKLYINYKGVKAEINGETKIDKTPTSELAAHGQLKFINGSYKAYGQALTIQENSSLSFFQQINNPRLNITASKHINVSPEYMTLPSYQPYLIAGVQVTGTADEPNIRLFSIPAGVSQQDILSYLIFGFPQNQLTNSQATILWNALSMMDTGQSNLSLSNLQRTVQKEFGFSEFGFGNTSEYNAATQSYESGTAFVVGKRITDKLTATYNVGILVPVNVLYLRYQLAQHWSLQSDSSALGNGGDIFYTIQRD